MLYKIWRAAMTIHQRQIQNKHKKQIFGTTIGKEKEVQLYDLDYTCLKVENIQILMINT